MDAGKGLNARDDALLGRSKASVEAREKFLAEWQEARRPIEIEEMELSRIRRDVQDAERELRKLKADRRDLLADVNIPNAYEVFETTSG